MGNGNGTGGLGNGDLDRWIGEMGMSLDYWENGNGTGMGIRRMDWRMSLDDWENGNGIGMRIRQMDWGNGNESG